MTRLDPGAGLTERLVTLPDGRTLRAVVAGTGDGPLVVFEAGMSAPAASWVHTQREIAAHARTLSYDRAGYGGSDVDPHPRTLERIVDDLTALLEAVGETQPVVLVGHSWGGPIMRVFADRHAERVAGLVFVDATVAEIMSPTQAKRTPQLFTLMSVVARLGGRALVRKASVPHPPSDLISTADQDLMWRDFGTAQAMRAGAREGQQILAALPIMRRLQETGTPDVPTVALQGGRVDRGMKTLRPLFNSTAADLMTKLSQGRFVVVADAGHLIPQEEPEAVRDAIVALLSDITTPATRPTPRPKTSSTKTLEST